MDKAKRKPGRRLTQTDRLKIRDLHASGKTVMEICRETGVAWDTAWHWINAPENAVTLPTEEILLLLQQRVGLLAIARRVKVPYRKIQTFAHAHGYRGPGPRWRPSSRQLVMLIDLTFAGNDSVSSIARKIRGPYGPIARLIHKVRRCPAFLTTKVLDSYLPMAHRETKLGRSAHQLQREDEAMLRILDLVKHACFDGKLPKDPTQLFAVAIAICLTVFRREHSDIYIGYTEQEKVTDYFLPRFSNALDTLHLADSGPVN